MSNVYLVSQPLHNIYQNLSKIYIDKMNDIIKYKSDISDIYISLDRKTNKVKEVSYTDHFDTLHLMFSKIKTPIGYDYIIGKWLNKFTVESIVIVRNNKLLFTKNKTNTFERVHNLFKTISKIV